MGCDIHVHIEFKYNGEWHHWSNPNIWRNYTLFAKMAGVRNYEDDPITPISLPKGLPDDITVPTRLDHETDNYHDESWLSCKEFDQLLEWGIETDNMKEEDWDYFFGNSFWWVHKSPKDFPKGIEDARVVFWFDN